MNRRAERKAENRAKLLAGARKVFAEKGYGAATARDIVRETDLASGTFYNYFTDKEAAFIAVMDDFTEAARAAARTERQRTDVNLEDRIYNAYRAYFELVMADPEMFEILRRNADVIAFLGRGELFSGGVSDLVEDFQHWVDAGELPAAVGEWLPFIARSIAGGGFQVAAHLAEQGESDPDAVARFCCRLLLDGIRGLG